jgi:peptidoglycan/LPS O-acetylase OafA/YrhL
MKSENINSLTGIRGVAAWWVVLYHFQEPLLKYNLSIAGIIEKGFLAVDLFFILSGFVLFINYRFDINSNDLKKIISFYVNRIARIYPLHLFIVILFIINPIAIHFFSKADSYTERYDIAYFFMSLLLIQNWGFSDSIRWNIPAWSISTELFSYVTFPFLFVMVKKISGFGLRYLMMMLCAILVLIPMIFIGCGFNSIGDGIPKIGLWRCVLEFCVGMIAGSLYLNYRSIIKGKSAYFFFASLILFSFSFIGVADYYYIPLAFFLLLLSLMYPSKIIGLTFGSGIFFILGEISYSTYLVHYFVKDWVKFLSADVGIKSFFAYLIIVFLGSIFLYRFIEMPGKRFIREYFGIV